jgi:hypothetical protein
MGHVKKGVRKRKNLRARKTDLREKDRSTRERAREKGNLPVAEHAITRVLERKEDGRVQKRNAGHAPHGQPAGSVQAEEGSGGLSRACVARDQDDVRVCVCVGAAVPAFFEHAWP